MVLGLFILSICFAGCSSADASNIQIFTKVLKYLLQKATTNGQLLTQSMVRNDIPILKLEKMK